MINIEDIATRAVWRQKDNGLSVTDVEIWKIPLSVVSVMPGLNFRTEFNDIPELAQDIMANGQNEPIEGYLLNDGRFIIVDGERRYKAMRYLNEVMEVDFTEVLVKRIKKMTYGQILARMIGSGLHKSQYTAMEMATAVKRLKEAEDLTNLEISNRLGKSRQWVDNQIIMASAPEEIQKEVQEGGLSFSKALSMQRDHQTNVEEFDENVIQYAPVDEQAYYGERFPTGSDIDEPPKFNKNDLHIPEKTTAEQEMIGVLPKATSDFRDAELDVKELKEEMESEEVQLRNPEVKKIIKNIRNLCAKLEGTHRGLPEQSQKDADSYLLWIRNDLNEMEMILKTNLKR